MLIQDRLKQVMIDNHLNIKEFSLKCDIPYRSLQDYLLGKIRPGTDALIKICTHLRVDLNWLLTGKSHIHRDQAQEQKMESKKMDEIEQIVEWLKDWWSKADERERYWMGVQIERTFPEYREWLEKQGF